jgi:hypothetical protein
MLEEGISTKNIAQHMAYGKNCPQHPEHFKINKLC